MAIHLGRPLPDASCDLPGQRRENPPAFLGGTIKARRPYLVLLPVRFTLPPMLPPARCALTTPFHPYPQKYRSDPARGGRFAFCGTFPGVTPAGCYPAPCFRGARTFLSPSLKSRRAAIRPSGGKDYTSVNCGRIENSHGSIPISFKGIQI